MRKEKVFCEDCKNYKGEDIFGHICKIIVNKISTPIKRQEFVYEEFNPLEKNNDCKDYNSKWR